MRKSLSISLLFFLIVLPVRTAALQLLEDSTTAELLLYYDWDELVTTAAKRSQKISQAPSPIYVFTAEDIRRTGVRTILELVQFIPGFYVYPRLDQPFVIASRGIRTNNNDNFLFLIDGIPLNSISKAGAVNADKFPGLDMVKRVEIISGPGSTLWGSDASLGIIHIITKDGKDVDGHHLNIDVATEDNHRQVNFISGKELSRGEYMFSATYAENDGFGDERYGYNNYVHDFQTIPWNDQRANFNHIYPSYEIYGKLTHDNFTIKALASEKSIYSFWNTSQATDWPDVQDKKAIITSQNIHLELSHKAELADNVTLDTKVSANQIDYTREKLVERGTNHGSLFDDPAVEPVHRTENHPEKGIGLEFMVHWDINERNKLLAGAEARVVKAGPGVYEFVNIDTGQPPASGEALRIRYNETTDTTYGVYAEDTFHVTDNLMLIGGARMDYNDPREEDIVVMVRGAAIYEFTDALTAKYMYNTGYVRPAMDQSFEPALSKQGKIIESEKIRAHDIALIYNTERGQLIVDVFYMNVYDLTTYSAGPPLAYVNAGDVFSHGVELSFKRNFLNGKLVFDLNYGYAKAEKENESGNKETYYLGIPNHLYNAGLHYFFTEKISLYANAYGWHELKMNNAEVTAGDSAHTHPDEYSGDYLVDLNLIFTDLLDDHLDISLYVKNAFDRDAKLQALEEWYSWWSYARDRSVGIKASWKF